MANKLIAIVGPTASGKTALSVEMARKYGGEIVCADSRTVRQHMDIGTAKPTLRERAGVPHHLLDVVAADETLSAGQFQGMAHAVIADIIRRGHTPFLVGGSGLYVDSVLYEYHFPGKADPYLRRELSTLTLSALVDRLVKTAPDVAAKVDLNNPRRVIRAIETVGEPKSRASETGTSKLVIGMTMNKELAQQRIHERAEKMLRKGILREVETLGRMYGWDSQVFSVTGYAEFRDLFLRRIARQEAIEKVVQSTLKLYKKQMTWFKRNKDIRWVDGPEEVDALINQFLRSNV
jgi:tRNA dimethylallyltransferase